MRFRLSLTNSDPSVQLLSDFVESYNSFWKYRHQHFSARVKDFGNEDHKATPRPANILIIAAFPNVYAWF
jgi:hypothetical protein